MNITVANNQHFNWRYLTTSRKYLLLTIGVAVGSVAVLVGLAMPQVEALNQLLGKSKQETDKVGALNRKVQQLKAWESSPDFGKAALVDQVLPSHKPLLELLTGLNQVVRKNEVLVTNIELAPGLIASQSASSAKTAPTTPKATSPTTRVPTKTQRNTDYDSMKVELTVEGTLDQINRLITDVEQLAPATTVTKLSLSKVNRPGQPALFFTVDLELTTYYFTKSITAGVESPLPAGVGENSEIIGQLDGFTYPPAINAQSIQGGGLRDLFGVTLEGQPEL